MNDVMKKRLIGVAILVIIGVLTPLLLSRCMHGGSEDNGQGSMRVYDVQPDGKAEPASDNGQGNSQENTKENQSETGSKPTKAPQSGTGSSSGNGGQSPQAASPDAVSPQSQSQFSTPPVHGNAGSASGSSNTAPAETGSAPTTAEPSQPSSHESSSETQPAPARSASTSQASSAHASGASGLEKSSIQGWVVQVASFSERGNAEDLAQKLKGKFPASYTPGQVKGKTWYRVNIGPFDSKQAAQSAADRLAKAGHKGLVRHLP